MDLLAVGTVWSGKLSAGDWFGRSVPVLLQRTIRTSPKFALGREVAISDKCGLVVFRKRG